MKACKQNYLVLILVHHWGFWAWLNRRTVFGKPNNIRIRIRSSKHYSLTSGSRRRFSLYFLPEGSRPLSLAHLANQPLCRSEKSWARRERTPRRWTGGEVLGWLSSSLLHCTALLQKSCYRWPRHCLLLMKHNASDHKQSRNVNIRGRVRVSAVE